VLSLADVSESEPASSNLRTLKHRPFRQGRVVCKCLNRRLLVLLVDTRPFQDKRNYLGSVCGYAVDGKASRGVAMFGDVQVACTACMEFNVSLRYVQFNTIYRGSTATYLWLAL
jgi:hypothetical protein